MAALLQYLFLSAFCWMMCEGIMLYLLLTVVFSSLSKKWWLFMILGYCKSYVCTYAIHETILCSRNRWQSPTICYHCTPLYTGTPLLFVIIGLAARAEYYGVHGDDGELTL